MILDVAKAALERIRQALSNGTPVDPQDVQAAMDSLSETEAAVLGAIDLLRASQNAFRSKQVAKARDLLEPLLSPTRPDKPLERWRPPAVPVVTTGRSKPTLCLSCKQIVEMTRAASPEPAWECPRCGKQYPDQHWKIRRADRGRDE